MSSYLFQGGSVVLPVRVLDHASVRTDGDRISSVSNDDEPPDNAEIIDLHHGTSSPASWTCTSTAGPAPTSCLTPARIAGFDAEIGSIEVGKRADLVVLDLALQVRRIYVRGRLCA